MRRLMVLLATLIMSVSPVTGAGAESDTPASHAGGATVDLPNAANHPPVFMRPRDARPNHGSTALNLYFHGGVGGVGVETAPRVYLVQWGSQWTGNDPSGEIGILTNFFNHVGASSWNNTVTQYCQGISSGSSDCSVGGAVPAGNPTGVLAADVWKDDSAAAPSHPSQSALANEAVRAAAHFGNTSGASNATVQYVILTAHNNNSSGFGHSFCAWHSSVSSSSGPIAYTNLPYITDAGFNCGANSVNTSGLTDGITIVAGHEFAETETDQFPSGGWLDKNGSEIGDKCSWVDLQNVSMNGGTFPSQPLWSNKTSACVQAS